MPRPAQLTEEEKRIYDQLRVHDLEQLSPDPYGNDRIAAWARQIVARQKRDDAFKSEAVKLSWLDKIALWGAWRVYQRKGKPLMDRMIGNWQTTLLGFVTGLVLYLQQNGGKVPSTWAEWQVALLAAAVAALGLTAKDASTGSEPGAKW